MNKLNNIQNTNAIKPFVFEKTSIITKLKIIDKTFNSTLVNISCNAIIPGNNIHNNSVFDIISLHLQTNLNDILREKYGLSYNPLCNYVIYKDFGIMELSATVKSINVKKSLQIIRKVLKQKLTQSKLKHIRQNAILTNHLLYESIESQSRFYCDELLKANKKINSIHDYDKTLQNTTIREINTTFAKLNFLTVMN